MLVGGTAGAQFLLLLAAPILTRLYTPQDFGLLAVYAGLVPLVVVISSLRYELAIPLPEKDSEAATIVVLCLILVTISSLITAILVYLLGERISELFGMPELVAYLWLMPIGVFTSGSYAVFNLWSVRKARFGLIAKTKFRQVIATIFIQLSSFRAGGLALLVGQVFGYGVGTTSLARDAQKAVKFRQVGKQEIVRAIVRYRKFPIFSTWEGLINTVSHQLAPLGFAAIFSVGSVGLYSLAHRVLSLPLAFIGSAIEQVFYSTAAAEKEKKNVGLLFEQLCGRLSQIGMPPMIILALVAPDLFEFAFGSEWRRAGEFAQWMTPWFYFQFISSPLSIVFSLLEESKQGMFWQLLLISLRGVALVIGSISGSILLAVIYFSLASALAYSVQVFWLSKLLDAQVVRIARQNLIALMWGIAIACPVIIVKVYWQTDIRMIIVGILLSLALLTGRLLHIVHLSSGIKNS